MKINFFSHNDDFILSSETSSHNIVSNKHPSCGNVCLCLRGLMGYKRNSSFGIFISDINVLYYTNRKGDREAV